MLSKSMLSKSMLSKSKLVENYAVESIKNTSPIQPNNNLWINNIHQTDKNRKKRVSLQQFEGKQKTNNHSVQRTCNDNSIISAKL